MAFRWLPTILFIVGFVACGDQGVPAPIASARVSIALTGPWADGDPIPRPYTCDGDNQSPPLEWRPVSGADEYALVMTDKDASGFVHWVVWDISSSTTRVVAGKDPAGAVSGTNSFGDRGYGGPCPPESDAPHSYEFAVFAVRGDPTSELEAGATAGDLYDAIECCVEGRGELTGTYERGG
jgi:Raf kinase inhibitor-like YbhB/YbcL family protein